MKKRTIKDFVWIAKENSMLRERPEHFGEQDLLQARGFSPNPLQDYDGTVRFQADHEWSIHGPTSLPITFTGKISRLLLDVVLHIVGVVVSHWGLLKFDFSPFTSYIEPFLLGLLSGLLSVASEIWKYPWRLVVTHDGLEVLHWFRVTRLAFRDIQSISITGQDKSFDIKVFATSTAGTETQLCPFLHKPFEVYRAVRTGWETSRKPAS